MGKYTISIDDEVEVFLQTKLKERLEKLTDDQRAFFHRIWPDSPPTEDIKGAIDLCDRTLRKNEAGR